MSVSTNLFRAGVARSLRSRAVAVLGFSFTIAVAGLLALSYRSLQRGEASTHVLAERRAEVILALLASALDRDMKAAQLSVLLPFRPHEPDLHDTDDLRDRFARAFARFPYPESFFVWTRVAGPDTAFYLFNRAERMPAWSRHPDTPTPYPAVLVRYPPDAHPLTPLLRDYAANNNRYAVFDAELGGSAYLVVAKVLTNQAGHAVDFIGFTVNHAWVRRHYFSDVAEAVLRVRDASRSASIAISDDTGSTVTQVGTAGPRRIVMQRTFSPLFFDPSVFSLTSSTPARPLWTTTVTMDDQIPSAVGGLNTQGTYLFLAVTAVVSLAGMLMTARAVRARAAVTEMHSEFISTVTHELKTPLASIRLMGETLGDGRENSVDAQRDYARLLSKEAWRLTRLIDNLLAYAAVSNIRKHASEPHEVAELVEDVLAHFQAQLTDQGFDVAIDIPTDLPRVRGDRTMLIHALENIIDNAIKYSTNGRRAIAIRCWHEPPWLHVAITDAGDGIPADELPRVCEKFYRGRGVRAGGSGLGLAIVSRVAAEHRGSVTLTSTPKAGTTVHLTLPVDQTRG